MSAPQPLALAATDCELRAAHARRNVVRMMRASGGGHLGGALSCLDIVVALYFHTMRLPDIEAARARVLRQSGADADADRDRFVLSAGHKCLAQYAVLAEAGFFPPEVLDTYGHLDSAIPGHPDIGKLPGIEANTGALGHGLAIALGMALGLRLSGTCSRVFTILGDGELPEGSNWEAFAAARHHRAGNMVAILDLNGLQISGTTAEVMDLEPIVSKLEAFGWATQLVDGHDLGALIEILDNLPRGGDAPQAIVARTIKGKGLSFAEGRVDYHYWKPSPDELAQATREVEQGVERWEVSR